MFWSGEKLKANDHVVSDFSENNIDCNAYTLSMGDRYYHTASEVENEQTKIILNSGAQFKIPPGQFAYLLSKESVRIPINAMAFISMRTKIKFQGLINVSGFHVDPGYKGKILFAVFNAGSMPVYLAEGEPLFKMWFCDLDRDSGEDFLFDSEPVNDISNDLVRGMSNPIFSLQHLSDKMQDQDRKINARLDGMQPLIDNLNNVYRAITIGIVLALTGAVLSIAGLGVKELYDYMHPKTVDVQVK